MRKRLMLALIALLATLGLTFTATPAYAAGALIMWPPGGFPGDSVIVTEGAIPTECAVIPFDTSGGAWSAANGTTGTEVRFYKAAGCAAADQLSALRPGDVNGSMSSVVTHYLGVPA